MAGFTSLKNKGTSGISLDGNSSAGSVGPFGTLLTSNLTPSGQGTFVYDINNTQWITSSNGTGAALSCADSVASITSGTSLSGSAEIRLLRRLKYRPGQGGICRLTAIFDNGHTGSYQLAGLGNSECGYYFAQNGENFGILHRRSSKVEIRKFTITSAPAGAATITVTLEGCAKTISINGGGSSNQTSYQISLGDYSNVGSGWIAEAIDGTVYFKMLKPGPCSGEFSIKNGASSIATVSTTQVGVLPVETFISQSNWNIDKLDGTGQSQFKLNPHLGNVYNIGYQYLGFGDPVFSVEDSKTGMFTTCHRINSANNATTTVLKNPQMSARWIAVNSGSNTSVTVRGASAGTFTEGNVIRNIGPSFAYFNTLNDVSTNLVPVMTLRPNHIFQNQSSYGEIDLFNISVGTDTGNASTIRLLKVFIYKNAVLNGPVNFQHIDTNRSVTSVDTAATSLTINGGTQLVKSFLVGSNTSEIISLTNENFFITTGETLTVAVQTAGGTISTVVASVSWFEDS